MFTSIAAGDLCFHYKHLLCDIHLALACLFVLCYESPPLSPAEATTKDTTTNSRFVILAATNDGKRIHSSKELMPKYKEMIW